MNSKDKEEERTVNEEYRRVKNGKWVGLPF